MAENAFSCSMRVAGSAFWSVNTNTLVTRVAENVFPGGRWLLEKDFYDLNDNFWLNTCFPVVGEWQKVRLESRYK